MTDDLETRLAVALQGAAGGTGWSIEDATFDARLILAALPAHGLVLRLASEPDEVFIHPAVESIDTLPDVALSAKAIKHLYKPALAYEPDALSHDVDEEGNCRTCAVPASEPDALRAAVIYGYQRGQADERYGRGYRPGLAADNYEPRTALSTPAPETEPGCQHFWSDDSAGFVECLWCHEARLSARVPVPLDKEAEPTEWETGGHERAPEGRWWRPVRLRTALTNVQRYTLTTDRYAVTPYMELDPDGRYCLFDEAESAILAARPEADPA